jgi:hypothetical protein
MNRFKRIVIFTVLIIISAGALFAIRNVERKMDDLVDQERLRFSGDVRNAPPLVAFTSVALGSFRGLIADLLWLRSENLKQEKSYFEMVQLARWITDLQPNYSGGTAYLAWNLAYNISVTCSNHEDRWRWVNEGISLIRDKALVYNPEDPVLYKELAWIFQHKLGNVLDDANLLYKNRLGMQITNILATGTPDWEALAAAPKNREEFLKLYPADHRLWQIARESGYNDFNALFLAFKNQAPAVLPQDLAAKLGETEFKKVDNFFRAELLRERMKLDPSKILEIDRKYGKMDWRVPESQAIYWATIGIEKTPGKEDLRCARSITQSLQAAFRGGRMLSMDDKTLSYVQIVPNLALADAAYNTYLETQEKYDASSGASSSFRSARINFLKPAVMDLYTYGKTAEAAKYFKLLIKEDGPQKGGTLEKFVQIQFADRIKNGTVRTISGAVNGLFFRSIVCLIGGDQEAAVAHERLARFVYNYYENDMGGTARTKLPPYKEMKAQIVTRLLEIWDKSNPRYAALLRAKIGEEEAAAADQKKNTAGEAGKK